MMRIPKWRPAWRSWLAGLVTGAAMTATTWALADIPDSRPSTPDSSHTFYACVANNGTGTNGQIHSMVALDKSLGDCPSASHFEVRLVPSAFP